MFSSCRPWREALAAGLAMLAGAAAAQDLPAARELRRFPAPEARQGVAVDADHAYAIDNAAIAKYPKAGGARLGQWTGDPQRFVHMNACAVIEPRLVCAHSNYPALPMASSVEIFDPVALAHLETIPLPDAPGSVTWIDRKDGSWFAGFANYDGRGGAPGRDHRATTLVQYDAAWRPVRSWTFPDAVLARFAPYSASGGGFGPDGLLYVTGHDRPELYALAIPAEGTVLELVATLPIAVEGQAIVWDRSEDRVLWGVSRQRREVVAMRIPPVAPPAR